MTNYNRVRMMSDKELERLCDHEDHDYDLFCEEMREDECNKMSNCSECWQAWLKREWKGDGEIDDNDYNRRH